MPEARPVLSQQPSPISSADRTPLRVVAFGDPGVGKTSFALTFPRPLVINTDIGLEGDALKMLKASGGYEHSPIGAKDLTALYYWIKEHSAEFDTIVIDSLDELVRILLDEIVDEGKGKRAADKGVGVSVLDLVPEQAEYLANQRQMHRFLHELRMLGKHIVVTSGVRDKGKRSIDISPGLATIVFRWASIMGELVVVSLEEGKPQSRVLVTDPGSTRSLNKTRYRALLPYVVEPNFTDMWSAIEADRPDEDRKESNA